METGSDTGLRFRQQAQLAVPLRDDDLTLMLAVEPFFNLRNTDWGASSGFDQSRFYVGIRMPMTEKVSLEAGYLNLYMRRAHAENDTNHIAILHFRAKL
jgi:hypothetical protein